MKIKQKYSQFSGFSLVELMIVVAIIGILSALAIPQFTAFQARARQAEARTNLSHIYNLQETFFSANNRYASFTEDGLSGLPTTRGIASAYGWSANINACQNTQNTQPNGLGFNLTCVTGQVSARYAYSWRIENGSNNMRYYSVASSDPTFSALQMSGYRAATPNAALNIPQAAHNNLIIPNCRVRDVFTIDNNKALIQHSNAVNQC